MAENAGIGEVGLVALEGVHVRPADADPANPDDGLARTGLGLGQIVPQPEGADFLAYDPFHVSQNLPERS